MLPMPFSNPRTYPGHSGVDFPQPRGTPIRASGDGVVLRLPKTSRGGYWTTIRYDLGATVGYAHQDHPVSAVRVGEKVTAGEVIGYVGSKGLLSTGPHLHMEIIGAGTYAAVWRWFAPDRWISPATSVSPPPTTTNRPSTADPEKEEDVPIIYAKPSNAATVYEIRNGKKRGLSAVEWKLVKAAYAATGTKVPYARGTVTAAALKTIPNA